MVVSPKIPESFTVRLVRDQNMHLPPLPDDLLAFIALGDWPRGHFSGSNLGEAAPFLARSDIDLLDVWGRPPPWPSPFHFFDESFLDQKRKLFRGSLYGRDIPLPWIDIERVQQIGEGADYGDDVFIMLDYRTVGTEPCVVARSHGRKPGRGWFQIAPDWRTFLALLCRNPDEMTAAALEKAARRREQIRSPTDPKWRPM